MAIGIKEDIRKRYVDKLFKVYLKNGQEQWLLLHIEVQNAKDEQFPERMFIYFYRIFDKYNKDIASFAVLADNDKTWRPNQYHRRILSSEITRTYETVKLIDFKGREHELLTHNNPFAMVVLVQLAALKTKPTDQLRFTTKLEFFRYLHKHGWPIKKSMNMFRFLDTILNLSPEFKLEYIDQAKKIDREYEMQLISPFERELEREIREDATKRGMQEGRQQGIQEGEAKLLITLLKAKFNGLPEDYINKISSADTDTLNRWGINILKAQELDQIFN